MFKKYPVLFFAAVFLYGKINAQVNLQTGSAVSNLPMFSWQDDKSRLNAVVALNYNSGNGLKVDDVASNVGAGWNLIAGGVISRMQIGEPDDQKPFINSSQESPEDVLKYPAGYLYNSLDISQTGCPKALAKYPLYEDKNHVYKQHNEVTADRELDRFSFQFNGNSGMFVVNNDNTCAFIGRTYLKGWFTRDESMGSSQIDQGIRTTINAFYLRDENGLVYKFSKLGLTKVLTSNYCDPSLTASQTQPKFKPHNVYHQSLFDFNNLRNPYIVNSWYLTEIKDEFTNRVISFTYRDLNIFASTGTDILFNSEEDYTTISHRFSKTITPAILSITFPDNHYVNFEYGAERADLSGEYCLSGVSIKYLDGFALRYLSKFQLNTTYFIKNRYGKPVSEYEKRCCRLCLKSVTKYGVDLKDADKPYIFDYYLGSNAPDDFVPPRFSPVKDAWGFFNGTNSTGFDGDYIAPDADISDLNNPRLKGLCFLKDPDNTITFFCSKNGYAKNGLIRQIIYPTGSSITYNYEQNKGYLNNELKTIGGVHVLSTQISDGGGSNDCDHPITTTYKYTLQGDNNSSSLWGLEMPLNSITATNHYAPEYRDWKYSFPFGECFYHYQWPGILSQNEAIGLTALQEFFMAISPVLDVVSAVSSIINIVSVIASANTWNVIGLVLDVILGLYTLISTCFTDASKDFTSTIYYNTDLNSINPLPVQFKRVEVVSSSGEIGKTVYEFTSDDDYDYKAPPDAEYDPWDYNNPELSVKQRYPHWVYGLPKMVSVYNASGNLVKQTESDYDFSSYMVRNNLFPGSIHQPVRSCKCNVTTASSMRSTNWTDANNYSYASNPLNYTKNSTSDMFVHLYSYYTGICPLTDVYERTFKPDGSNNFSEKHTHYTYPNVAFLSIESAEENESNGDKYLTEYTYTSDINGGIIDNLKNKNIISLPVSTSHKVWKNGGEAYQYLNEEVTEFTALPNGNIKPYRVLAQRYDRPQTSMNLYQGPVYTDYTPYKEIQTFIYSASSTLAGLKDEGSHTVSNIYDYNDKYIVASVINAVPLIDKIAYTSFETNSLGGWQVRDGRPTYITTDFITGTKAYDLSYSELGAFLNTARQNTLSFWSTNAISVSATSGTASLAKSAPVINGLKYYEYTISQGATEVHLSGNGHLDELRLYPSSSRMRTVTYDPMIGKTSECDENNRITYYEYDNLSRLRFVKDENRNIIKMYEYNTVSKQGGCPGTYYNKLITEVFTKSNCGSEYAGKNYTYTVPANKYSSTISQEDADMQAENEINASGQAAANSHSSSEGCSFVYYNHTLTDHFTTQGCPIGTTGGDVTYTVPEHRYISLIGWDDADDKAREEIDANGQAYANSPAHRICNSSTTPDWRSDEPVQLRCQVVGGHYTGHQEMRQTDKNPNSSSYQDTRWVDIGLNTASCQKETISINGSNVSSITTFYATFYYPGTNTIVPGGDNIELRTNINGEIICEIYPGTYDVKLYHPYNTGYTYDYLVLNVSRTTDDQNVLFSNVTVSSSIHSINITGQH